MNLKIANSGGRNGDGNMNCSDDINQRIEKIDI